MFYFVEKFVFVFSVVGGDAADEEEEEDACGPPVDSGAVFFFFDDFGGHVFGGSAEGDAGFFGYVFAWEGGCLLKY